VRALHGLGVRHPNPTDRALTCQQPIHESHLAGDTDHPRTLAEIADVKPPSAAALRRVKGIGPAKVDAYGDEILELVRRLR
jgi:hypothetical protein